MSILTKISVVILVVASIVASVVFTSLATVSPNWKQAFERERQAYGRLDGRSQEYMAETVQLRKQLGDATADFDTKYGSVLDKADLVDARSRQLELQNEKHVDNRAIVAAQLTELQQISKRYYTTLVQYRKERDAARETLATRTQTTNSVTDLLAHAESVNEQLQLNLKGALEAVAELQAQLAQKDETIGELRKSGGKLAKDTGDVYTGGDAITGTITAVDDQLVAINVGSANGIKKSMKLIVYRGGQFVGHIRIQQVKLSEAVGLVIDKKMNPQPGDKATTRLD